MRTTTIGWTTEAGGATPGIRRPVRTMTEPPTPSRRMRFGLPTSPVVSGVIVAALSPRPVSRMAAAASWTTALAVARRFSRDRSKWTSSRSNPRHVRVEDPQRLVEQLLAGLVAVAHDDLAAGGHAVQGRTNSQFSPTRGAHERAQEVLRA